MIVFVKNKSISDEVLKLREPGVLRTIRDAKMGYI